MLNGCKKLLKNNPLTKKLILTLYVKKWDRVFKEKKCRGGKDREGSYYVIRRRAGNVGLFSLVVTALAHMKIAEEQGRIPVVDLQNYKNLYLPEDKIGTENAWEYFFEQPCNTTLFDIKNKKDVLLSSGEIPQHRPSDTGAFFRNENGEFEAWRALFQKYIRPRTEIVQEADAEYARKVAPNEKVVGVCCRGAKYRALRQKNHPIQPEVDELIAKVKETMAEFGAGKVYLSTEDAAIVEQFRAEFQDALFVADREYMDFVKQTNVKSGTVYNGVQYLKQIIMLSKCDFLVSARCSGALGASLMSKGYAYTYYFDKGDYQ